MKTVLRFTCIFFLLWVAACVPFPQTSNEVLPTSATEMVIETAIPAIQKGINEQLLNNMAYIAPNTGVSVQLTDGTYTDGTLTVTLLPQFALGDLNEDGQTDAAVLLAENDGGTGTFVSLVILTDLNGEIVQVGNYYIDDRPIIQALTISEGAIQFEATVHGINDPMASPTLAVKQTYKLIENYPTLVSMSSTVQGGTERAIMIDSPTDGSEASGSVRLVGSMPIAPFENNLRLRILDVAGTELFTSGFMVTSADLGSPAAFENEIILPTLPSESWVRLELAELSMADGSLVDMNSVLVKIK